MSIGLRPTPSPPAGASGISPDTSHSGARSSPPRALELDTEFLKILKALGDGAVHPNDGDVDKQAAWNNSLLAQVKETFQMLLYLVYEVPHEKNQRLEALRVKTKIFKRDPWVPLSQFSQAAVADLRHAIHRPQ